MKALVFTAAILAISAVPARSGPAKERNSTMRNMQDNGYNPLREMAQGKQGFDAAAVQRAYSVMQSGLDKVTGLWPPGSPSRPETRFGSSPKIWESKADFEARLSNAKKIVAATQAQAMSGVEGVKAAVSQLEKGCGGCHEDYRVRQR